MRKAEEKRFALSGVTLTARYWSGEGVPILALHGFLDNANSFEPLAEHLPNPMLALDFAGHGRSDYRPLGAQQMFLDHVEDSLNVAIQHLGWEEMILLGHSMGAGVATLVAASRMLPLTHLLLIDGIGPMTQPAKLTASNFTSALKKRMETPRPKRVFADAEAAAQTRTQGFGGLSLEASRLLCERGLMPCEGGFVWSCDARLRQPTLVYMEENQVESLLHQINVPTLLIKALDGIGGKGMLDRRIGHVKGIKVVELPGRHHLHMEQPEGVAKVLLEFLVSVDDRSAEVVSS